MKLFVLSPDATGNRDGTVQAGLLDHLPNQVGALIDSDVVIIPISYIASYRFYEGLLGLKKRWVLLDYCEYGWDAGDKENRFGHRMTHQFGHLNTPDYCLFDKWVEENPPVLTFKRELFKRDVTPTMLPCEFPCQLPAPPLQSKAEFDARPIEVFFCWGHSHPSRPRLHGSIFEQSHNHNYTVVDHWDDLGRVRGNVWASIHSPWYRRKPMNEVMEWNYKAKISVSLFGAGRVCFRHTMESPVGSIMALQEDDLAWSFEWTNGVNCIRLGNALEFSSLVSSSKLPDLWEIYRNGQCTVDRYRSKRYVSEYILPNLERVL